MKLVDTNEKKEIITDDLICLLRKLDQETFLHSMRVGEMLYRFGHFLDLSTFQINQLHIIGYIHDIGKIYIPSTILKKNGPLTDTEWNIKKKHVLYGYDLLTEIIEQEDILNAVKYHHENLDGSGYEGLKEQQIDFNTRLIRIIDSFDTLTNKRCFNQKHSIDFSLNKIQKLSGTIYDHNLVDKFTCFINKIRIH